MKLEANSRLGLVTASYHGDRGTYASVLPIGVSRTVLHDIAKTVNEGEVINIWDLHATVIWSSQTLSEDQQYDLSLSYDVTQVFTAVPKEFVVWQGHKGEHHLVLILDSDALKMANAKLRSYGLTSDFDYNPHITFSNNIRADYSVVDLNRMLSERPQPLKLSGLRLEDAHKTSTKTVAALAPDGSYSGIHSGDTIRFTVNDRIHEMRAPSPLRGRKPVTVMVTRGVPSIKPEGLVFGEADPAAVTKLSRLATRTDPFRLTDAFMDVPLEAYPGKDGTCVGSGVLFWAASTDRMLFVKRSMDSDSPGMWCCLGGGVEIGETIEQGARREVVEEGGYSKPYKLRPMHKTENGGTYVYHNHFARVPDEFTPVLNDEHTEFVWSKTIPTPCHPKLLEAIRIYQDAKR